MGVPTYMGMGTVTPLGTWVFLQKSHESLGSASKPTWKFQVRWLNSLENPGFAHKIQLPVWVCPLQMKLLGPLLAMPIPMSPIMNEKFGRFPPLKTFPYI
eukprot:TRINITY_DN33196_c0_g1_i1.p1 TRINITY_DN33196_c0_g1~~TRINITY_DN33196_c0_g1_i1.p1  ORF type:complete len:100 (-),score=4.80 TRINITY_DN33196_c0_g1_i1:644-943(-)